MFLTIIIFVLVLSVLVFVHELGHFWTARRFGVKAEEFGFGLPPRMLGFYKSTDGKKKFIKGGKDPDDAADTIWSLNWLPLGGFVKIKGEDGVDTGEQDNLNSKPIWQRATIMSAGVFMNIVLAVILFSIGFMIGLPQGIDQVDSQAKVSGRQVQVVSVLPDSPAQKAGIRMADIVISVNNINVVKDVELQELARANVGTELVYKVQRGDKIMDFKVTPEVNDDGQGEVGVAIVNIGLVKYPWYLAIWKGLVVSISLIGLIIVAFFELFKGLFTGAGFSADVAGPVGIATMTGQFARMGFVYLLQFTALLSVNLAVINFLPIPALDGGRVLFLIIEKIKGSPVKRELEGAIHNIGFMLLMLLILIVTIKDVSRFTDSFIALWQKIF